MNRCPTAILEDHIEEVSKRKGDTPAEILSVTNMNGFVRSLDVFDKQVYSQDACNYKLVRFNEIAYNPSRINVGSVARCHLPEGGAVSPMYTVLRCRETLLPPYLLYFLKSEIGRRHIVHRCVGAVRFMLRFEDLEQIGLPLPSIPDQDRIVRILDEADTLRRLREQADRRTADLIPALFHEMFGDPATNLKGWPVVQVRDVITSCDYGTSTKGNDDERGLPVIRMGNVTIDGRLNLTDLKHVELSAADVKKFSLQHGDILFNRTNSRELVGKTGMWDGRFPAVAASYFIRLRFSEDKEHPQHFTTFMNLPKMKRELAGMARGAVGQANINGKELQGIRFPLPPISLQRKFADRVAEIRAMEAQQAESCRRLANLFQSLLHRAFLGDL